MTLPTFNDYSRACVLTFLFIPRYKRIHPPSQAAAAFIPDGGPGFIPDGGPSELFASLAATMLAKPDGQLAVGMGDRRGNSLLHALCSCRTSSWRVVDMLVAAGADVNAVDADGRTPLQLAASNADNDDSPELVAALLSNNADMAAGERGGGAVLHMFLGTWCAHW